MSIDNSGDINTIILAAGKFNPKNISSGMITDRGCCRYAASRPINWCIDAAKKNGAGDIKIVLRSSNTPAQPVSGLQLSRRQADFRRRR